MSKTNKTRRRMKFFFLKLPIFLAIFLGVMIGALKLVERYPEPLKEGFEKYLTQQSGMSATIEKLEKVEFFPDIDIRVRNLTMHRAENAAIIDVEAEKFFISVPLSSMFLRQGKINFIDIENFQAKAGILTPGTLFVEKAAFVDPSNEEEGGKPALKIQGTYFTQPFVLTIDIDEKDGRYVIPTEMVFSVRRGAYHVTGQARRHFSKMTLSGAIMEKGDQKSRPKDYILFEKQAYQMDNPLSCLYMTVPDDLKQCDKYLKDN